MLGRGEAAIVARERDLPGLGLLLDDEAFGERLGTLLPDADVRSARAVYLRYKPGTSCLVAYRVLGRDGEMDVHALARRSGTPKLAKVRRRADRGERARLFVLEDDAVVVALFPEDNELPVLARLVEPSARREMLERLLGRDHGFDGPLVRLRYKPERRWVGRLTSDAGPGVVLKAYARAGFDAALRGGRAWSDRPPLRVARLVGALPDRRLIAWEWITGRALGEALRAGEAGPMDVALAGEALACVHSQPAAGLPVETPAGHARRVLAAAAAVGAAQPALSARAERLAREISDRLAAQAFAVVPTHGDFHAGQVLLADGAVAAIDFDEATGGAPASDLASFLAHLEARAGAGSRSATRTETLSHALLDGYARRAAPPSAGELVVPRAAALFRVAPHFFRDRDPEWPERTEEVLDRIEALLGGSAARAVRPAGRERLA